MALNRALFCWHFLSMMLLQYISASDTICKPLIDHWHSIYYLQHPMTLPILVSHIPRILMINIHAEQGQIIPSNVQAAILSMLVAVIV